ncbi:hypothetical protein Q5512_07635 [Escherichia coli]|nr:hypothetical protein [Escherichia coli]
MNPEDSVLQELEQLTRRMYQLCVDNNIAFVSCYSYEISRNETGMATSRHLSVYVDEEKMLSQLHTEFCNWNMSLEKLFLHWRNSLNARKKKEK